MAQEVSSLLDGKWRGTESLTSRLPFTHQLPRPVASRRKSLGVGFCHQSWREHRILPTIHGKILLTRCRERVCGEQEDKTNPFEPIEVNSRRFKEMSEILINRTHSSYFTCFQTVTAKLRPISGNYVPSRTRIRGRARLAPLPIPQNDPGMSFRMKEKVFQAAPTHQDLAGGQSARAARASGRGLAALVCRHINRHPVVLDWQQSRNMPLFQGDGARW